MGNTFHTTPVSAPSTGALTLADLQTITRYSARNAGDSSGYPPEQVDLAIQASADEFLRITRATRRLDTIALTIGSATVPAFPDNFLPDRAIETYLTLSGNIIKPGISFTTIENVLSGQQQGGCVPAGATPPTSPPTGQPTLIGFEDRSTAILNRLPDKAYTLNVYWWEPFTSWTAGSGSSSLTFNLSDEALRIVAGAGAAYFLQRMEPANAGLAAAAHVAFIAEAKKYAGRGGGGRGAQSIQRQSPYTSNGTWTRGNN